MRDSAVWRLLQKIAPKNRTQKSKTHLENLRQNPLCAKIRTKNSATKLCTTKSVSNLQPKSSVNLQDKTCRAPQRVSQRSRGVPPEISLLVAPKSVTPKKFKPIIRHAIEGVSGTQQKSLAASDFSAAGEAKNLAISAAEWLWARLQAPWSLRFCDAIFVPLGAPTITKKSLNIPVLQYTP